MLPMQSLAPKLTSKGGGRPNSPASKIDSSLFRSGGKALSLRNLEVAEPNEKKTFFLFYSFFCFTPFLRLRQFQKLRLSD